MSDDTQRSERLRHLIDARGLTQTEIASRMGLSVPTISCYVSGAREPQGERRERFAEVLGLTVEELTDLLPRRDRREPRSIALPERSWGDLEELARHAGRPVDDVAAELLSLLFPGRHDAEAGSVRLALPEASWERLEALAAPLGLSPEELCERILSTATAVLSAVEGRERGLLGALLTGGGSGSSGG